MTRLALFYRRLAFEGPGGLSELLLLGLLIPLGCLYGAVGRLRTALYRMGVFSSWRAGVPVVSVGNLTVGGTGKTPFVDALIRDLLAQNKRVAVISRGYGGQNRQEVAVVSGGDGPLLSPLQCGDEPYLLAKRNPRAVILTARRRAQGVRLAEERYGAEVILLDDGFQHLAVQRDLDILLLDARRPLGNGWVLPAGLLRESPAALRRADLCVFTRSDAALPFDLTLDVPVVRSRHLLADEAWPLEGEKVPLEQLVGRRGVAFAGIADPGDFFAALKRKGLTLVRTVALADHVAYDATTLARLAAVCDGADFLVTTEKDGVKLKARDVPLPCYQIPLSLEFSDKGVLDRALESIVREGETMSLPKELRDILACPKCKGEVHEKEDGTGLVCEECRLVYPVRDHIPVMLIDEAKSF